MQHSPRLDSKAVFQRCLQHIPEFVKLWTLPYPPLPEASHFKAPRQLLTRSECCSQQERRHGGAEHTSRGAEPGQPPRQSTACKFPGTKTPQPSEVAPWDHKHRRLHSLTNQLNYKDSLCCLHALRQGALWAITNNYLNTRAMRRLEWEPDASSWL